jgi:hypothetical protein
MQNSYSDFQEHPLKRQKLNPYTLIIPPVSRKRKFQPVILPTTCRQEMKKQKLYEYCSKRTTPKNIYDFLIISSLPNCIHRYIK